MNAVVKESLPSIMPHRLKLAESMRMVYQATVEPSVKREDLTDPSFWKHVAPQLQPSTRIEVVPDDISYFCELIVLSSGANQAIVKELRYVDLAHKSKITRAQMVGYEAIWKGPVLKWCAARKSDNELIKKEMNTQDQAESFIKEYVKTISK